MNIPEELIEDYGYKTQFENNKRLSTLLFGSSEAFMSSDSLHVCKILADMGIDMIEVSGGSYSSREVEGPMRNTENNESYFKDYASKIAEEVEVPVALVGGNRKIEKMTEILNTTKIDYFSMARPFIHEPDIINRWIKENQESAECESCDPCNGVYNGCKYE